MPQPLTDIWQKWLLESRFRGDRELMNRALTEFLYPIRDRVLDNAALKEGETLLDVGCGDGLLAFGALERTQSSRIIFSDISRSLLDHVATLAQKMGVAERCDFIEASADDLSTLSEGSVDVVTTRSVLIYVDDKARALAEFHRVLRPGGRVSLFEPINRFGRPEPPHLFAGYDVTPVIAIVAKLKAFYSALQPWATDPMVNFDERDLFALAEAAGFDEVQLDLNLALKSEPRYKSWNDLLHIPGNPKIPSLAELMAQTLSTEEQAALTSHLKPLVEAGMGRSRSAVAYLWAAK
jgi:ubiquinone/menaquinone biosynthesis C-methylase UbiE